MRLNEIFYREHDRLAHFSLRMILIGVIFFDLCMVSCTSVIVFHLTASTNVQRGVFCFSEALQTVAVYLFTLHSKVPFS